MLVILRCWEQFPVLTAIYSKEVQTGISITSAVTSILRNKPTPPLWPLRHGDWNNLKPSISRIFVATVSAIRAPLGQWPNMVLRVILLPGAEQVESYFFLQKDVWGKEKLWLWTWDQRTTFSKSGFCGCHRCLENESQSDWFCVIFGHILVNID